MERTAASALIAIALVASAVAATVGRAATPAGSLRADVVAAGSPGALVLVDNDASRTEAVNGLASLRGAVPLRARDRFRAGSITKTFVAVVVLQLVQDGRLRLDETVEGVLPGLLPDGGRITVRQLLGHTSALADYAADDAFLRRTVRDPGRSWTPHELLEVALRLGPVGSPGERFVYASTNYVVLGLLVERVTDTTIAEQLRRRIIVPLGLRDTSFSSGRRIPGRHAHGYAPSQHDGIVGRLATARDRSEASDLSRFLGALLGGRLLRPRSLALMRPAPGERYGLGLAAFRTPCGTAVGHTGNLLGTVSAAWSTADGRRCVVAMTNSYPLSPAADTAFRHMLDKAFCGG